MVLKERFGFYKSQIKSRLSFVKTKFMALSKWLKIAVITALISSFVGLILFINRDKPESMIKYADKSFEFSANEDLKPFISYFPKLGEDLLLKKIVVNLKQTDKHKYAMGMFEIFLNIKSNSLLQMVSNKQYLVQDVIQRELESFSYEKLSTAQGKKVAKIILRNRVNKALGRKAIKRLYFKTFVIQP